MVETLQWLHSRIFNFKDWCPKFNLLIWAKRSRIYDFYRKCRKSIIKIKRINWTNVKFKNLLFLIGLITNNRYQSIQRKNRIGKKFHFKSQARNQFMIIFWNLFRLDKT